LQPPVDATGKAGNLVAELARSQAKSGL